MRICLITPEPGHPLLAAATELLRGAGHPVESLDPGAVAGAVAGAGAVTSPADVYLLKSRTPQALALAVSYKHL